MNVSAQRVFRMTSVLILASSTAVFATTTSLRIATYNVQLDVTGGPTTPNAYIEPVLQAIGSESTYSAAHPLDILGLEETTSNTVTVAPIVSNLNSFYGAGTYTSSSYQATQSGGASGGNGPNAIIYNQNTLSLIASTPVTGTPTSQSNPAGTRINRQVVRYEFTPLGAPLSTAFYVYVSHMKSSFDGDEVNDQNDRNLEAIAIRDDEATLPASANVLYMGDYNMGSNTEAGYTTMASLTSPTAGKTQGAAVDPLNPLGTAMIWDNSNKTTAYKAMITESTQSTFEYRDDLMLMTQNVFNGTGALDYLSGTEHAFGNTSSVNSGSKFYPASLPVPAAGDFSNLRYDLNQASDHLPVVADYTLTFGVPEPGTLMMFFGSAGLMGMRRRRVR